MGRIIQILGGDTYHSDGIHLFDIFPGIKLLGLGDIRIGRDDDCRVPLLLALLRAQQSPYDPALPISGSF